MKISNKTLMPSIISSIIIGVVTYFIFSSITSSPYNNITVVGGSFGVGVAVLLMAIIGMNWRAR